MHPVCVLHLHSRSWLFYTRENWYRLRAVSGAHWLHSYYESQSQGKCRRGESFLTLDFYLMAFYLCILVYLLPILLRLHVCIPSSLKLNPKLKGYFIVRNKLI